VYRFAYTMALSIFSRITGVALALGLIVLAIWLMAVAGGEATYQRFTGVMSHGLLQAVLGGWLFAFIYHFSNGIRHLLWDAGYGFERVQARRSAVAVVAFVALMTVLLLYLFFCPQGARS
jgi:succinate dehydrogenase / fumarate reductase cytochrome b subunit